MSVDIQCSYLVVFICMCLYVFICVYMYDIYSALTACNSQRHKTSELAVGQLRQNQG